MMIHDNRLLPRFLLLAVGAVLFPWSSVQAGHPDAWRATAVQGEATLQEGENPPVPVVEGSTLERGQRLATGAAGRVVLTRGWSTITVGPNGRMEIPAGGDDGRRTKIVQAMGSLVFKVEKRASQHFEVDTPYLAAVVKGTTFTVSVDSETSAVHVVEGAVEVTALATGQVGLIKPGFTAVVSPRKGSGLSVMGPGQQKPDGQGLGAQADDPAGAVEEGDQAAGRAVAPGQVKRLHAMLGQASIDVAAASNGFVRNAGPTNGQLGGGKAVAVGNGSGTGKSLTYGQANGKTGAGAVGNGFGLAKANPGGGGNGFGLAKANSGGGNSGGNNRNSGGGNGKNGSGNNKGGSKK